eukprot:15479369-Alexandrium_andersonii.AAC.1
MSMKPFRQRCQHPMLPSAPGMGCPSVPRWGPPAHPKGLQRSRAVHPPTRAPSTGNWQTPHQGGAR